MEQIQESAEFNMYSEDTNQQWMENIQVPKRSIRNYRVVQANEDENQKGIEHIRQGTRSISTMWNYGVVQANEDEIQQGIEHIRQGTRSISTIRNYRVVQTNEDENQQGIEHIRQGTRSISMYYGVEQANQDEDLQEIEHIREATRSIAMNSEVVQDEDVNQHGVEHIQNRILSFLMNGEEENQQEIEQIRDSIISFLKHENQQEIKQIRDRMLSFLMYDGGAQANEDENQQEIKHVQNILSISFELLELVENENLAGEEQPTPRSEVLKIIKFLHDKGLDSAQHEVKQDLEKVNQNHYDNPTTVQHVKKYLGLMSRMFNSGTFQRTICKIMSKAESDQLPCKHCKKVQANEGENQLGMEHKQARSHSFVQYESGHIKDDPISSEQ